jgi:hypothetical protein
MKIDVKQLENVRRKENCIEARCPACNAVGGDRRGNNLVVFDNGAFYCHAYPKDRDHNRQILRLAGGHGDHETYLPNAEEIRRREMRRADEERTASLVSCIRQNRARIFERFQWTPSEVRRDSPQPVDKIEVSRDPRQFLRTLFSPDDLLWTGEFNDTGKPQHIAHWQTCREWAQDPDPQNVGPYTTPATWPPGVYSRAAKNTLSVPYAVFDFDGFDGKAPTTPEEVDQLVRGALAIIRMFREALHWDLASIVWTGNKGLHAWFECPCPAVVNSVREVVAPLGLDPKLLDAGQQPCRLPGHMHPKSGKVSEVWWLSQPRHNDGKAPLQEP